LTATAAREVVHWYDFVCPFCYVGQQRNSILVDHGFALVAVPFQAHPEIPSSGRIVGERSGSMYEYIEAEARAAHLPLVWPARLPNTRMALAAAEWTRRHAPRAFSALQQALFAAHFAHGEDLGDRDVIGRHADQAGADVAAMLAALDSGAAYALVDECEAFGRRRGVRGTPAWLLAGHLISGLYPRERFEQLARAAALP
jgi:predicted DsbA family dithiol-disulfide isomerase